MFVYAPIFIAFCALFTGIMSVVSCKSKQKAKLLLSLGIAVIIIAAFFLTFIIYFGFRSPYMWIKISFLLLIGFILPVLCIVGARKNMR